MFSFNSRTLDFMKPFCNWKQNIMLKQILETETIWRETNFLIHKKVYNYFKILSSF